MTSSMTLFGIIWDGLIICEVRLKLCLIFQNFKMAAILSSQQTFLPDRRCSWDRRCSSNIGGDISISKFDPFCYLMTASMTSRIYTDIIVVISL